MKLYLIFATALSFFLTTCSEELLPQEGSCGTTTPTEDLGWLNAKISELENEPSETLQYQYVSQAIYQGDTVFLFNNCCPNCAVIVPVYNCTGERLGYVGENGFTPDLFNDAFVVWQPENFSCNL